MSGAARDLERIEELEGEVVMRDRRIKELETGYEQALAELNEQCRFWRRAAEQAVDGWNALEDKVQAVLEVTAALESNTSTLKELLVELSPVEPPDLTQGAHPIGSASTALHIVEDEKPLELSCGHTTADHPNARNYLEGAAENDGPVCILGWPAVEIPDHIKLKR